MKIILSLLLFVSLYAEKIMVLNSNNDILKYKETVDAFSKEFKKPFTLLDISKYKDNTIKEILYDEYPDIVYTVGAKAYQYANLYLPEKTIYFSSIVNWKRLIKNKTTYGVSDELHSGMKLTLIKSIFTNTKNLGVIYSDYTKDIVSDLQKNSISLGMNIVAHKVTKQSIQNETFSTLLDKVEAILVIPDPVLMANQAIVTKLFSQSKEYKVSIFAYHKVFLKYGALLSISVDNPTTGRQVASMIQNKTIKTKIQYPAGTRVIFNKKEAVEQNVIFNKNIMSLVNKVIE